MAEIPVISNHILHGMPAFLRQVIGDRALRQANRAVGFDLELTEGRNCFIPHAAVIGFLNGAARAAGEPYLGLLLAPVMDAANYGSFGHYVLGADTLGNSIARATAALCYHSTDDRMSVAVVGDEARFSYVFALAGRAGYDIVACAAAGVLMSVLRAYLPIDWRPQRIELDIDKPRQTGPFEDVFQCPVIFNAPAVTIVMERHQLSTAQRRASWSTITIEDVARDRQGGAPRDVLDVVVEQIRAQVLTGSVTIDSAAQSMDISVRTLQRALNRAGTDFRSLANAARLQRAIELLRHTRGSVTRVSAEMGYSSPANFARAFRRATGRGPREFRAGI
ncbi:AraC family transcriptional regulator [Chelatococcus asaccharovorans]|uniref:AraC family transcriptional regulator n=1 Tax=Chelatococcus asaccharovorans TaxID=28210 RepID=UPI00224C6B9C|nr:AraC family transcriptional regulator [Chelatococcus asaccharovorans]CAH1670629.1 AraC-like DNA-binding protein [Chelatococcus asaccharovorans]CAH1677920.1 AraC-like DNA-binding protein [Chelatococcus asaccharovorans]